MSELFLSYTHNTTTTKSLYSSKKFSCVTSINIVIYYFKGKSKLCTFYHLSVIANFDKPQGLKGVWLRVSGLNPAPSHKLKIITDCVLKKKEFSYLTELRSDGNEVFTMIKTFRAIENYTFCTSCPHGALECCALWFVWYLFQKVLQNSTLSGCNINQHQKLHTSVSALNIYELPKDVWTRTVSWRSQTSSCWWVGFF